MRSRTAPAAVVVLALAALLQPTAASAARVDWGPVQQVSQHPALGSPDVAVGPRTGTGVVWTSWSAGGTDIRFRQRTPEGAWQRVRSLGAGSDPQIGMDASGNAFVVWQRTRSGMIPEVVTARRTVGGTWSVPEVLSRTAASTGSADTRPTNLRLAVSSGGAVVAAWRWGDDRGDGPGPRVQAAYRPAGGSWQAPTDLTTPSVCSTGVAAAIGPQGRAVVVCVGSDGVQAIQHLGDLWTTPAVVSPVGVRPDVAIGPSGGTVAVWQHYTGPQDQETDPTSRIEVSRLTGSWSPPAVALGGDGANEPRVAVSGGVTTVVWTPSIDGVLAATRRSGWSAPFGASHSLSVVTAGPRSFDLAANARGDLVVASRHLDALGYQEVGVTRPAHGRWTDPVVLSGSRRVVPEADAAGVAVSSCGRAYVAWADTRVRLRYAADCAR